MTELVKNSHDADASFSSVEFREDDEIVIRDDGCGMDLDTLLGSWMQPAGTTKSGLDGRRTPRGRRMLGEKGVGRFAADKLGGHLELISRQKGDSTEVRAVFDWDAFDDDSAMLSDVRVRWEMREASEIAASGTVLRISRLRSRWTERSFRRLSTRLSRLISPFSEQQGFSIRIESDAFPEYSGEIHPELLERAPYRVDASYDGEDAISIALDGDEPAIHRWNGDGELTCGPVRIRIFGFDLETDAVAQIGPRMEVRAWLKEWTGISVYRDGFRVWPYGEPHDDWLRLDQRRVNNPVVRLSNNQVIGFVEISRDANPELRDQTNREGLLHNEPFEDLRRLMYLVLQILEAERQQLRHPRSAVKAAWREHARPSESIAVRLKRIATEVGGEPGRELLQMAETLGTAGSTAALDGADQGVMALAALGQTTIGVSDAVAEALAVADVQAQELIEALPRGERQNARGGLRESLAIAHARISQLSLLETATRSRRTIDVGEELRSAVAYLEPTLAHRGVSLDLEAPGKAVLRSEFRPEDLHGVLQILVQNSLDWVNGDGGQISVTAGPSASYCRLVFSDTGPGIDPGLAELIFRPGYSSKEGGRGMGLWIARHLLARYGGAIALITDRRRRGANFEVLLARKRSRATPRHRT